MRILVLALFIFLISCDGRNITENTSYSTASSYNNICALAALKCRRITEDEIKELPPDPNACKIDKKTGLGMCIPSRNFLECLRNDVTYAIYICDNK